MKYIKAEGRPDRAARKAYREGFYLEAIQVLHRWLESQAGDCLVVTSYMYFVSEQTYRWDLSETVPFKEAIKVLFMMNQINLEEYEHLRKSNILRNKLIYSIYRDAFHQKFKGILKSTYDEIFNKTLSEGHFFESKLQEIAS